MNRAIFTITLPRVLLLLALAVGLGCEMEQRVIYDPWANLRELADKPADPDQAGPAADLAKYSGWAVLLESFEGEGARRAAERLQKALQRQNVPDLWLRDEPVARITLYRGRYQQPDQPDAQRDLRQSRILKVAGERPFADAQVVPLGRESKGAADKLDLRGHSGAYTLQVGYYDERFGEGYREAAEEATRALREQGHEAFYYHGPHRSLITVGLFSEYDVQQEKRQLPDGRISIMQVYSQQVRDLQKTFEYNLANGVTMIEHSGGEETTQPSFLVRVP